MVRERVRIRFCKQEDLRFIGHRDLVRLLERLFRRAGLQLGMSQGFHPKPRMSFPLALAVGIEGLDEVMELELAQTCDGQSLQERLARHAVAGLEFRRVDVLAPATKKAQVKSVTYEIPIPADRHIEVKRRIARLLAAQNYPIQQPRKNRTVDLRPSIEDLLVRDGTLTMRLAVGPRAGATARDVLEALELADLEQTGICLGRTAVQLHE